MYNIYIIGNNNNGEYNEEVNIIYKFIIYSRLWL